MPVGGSDRPGAVFAATGFQPFGHPSTVGRLAAAVVCWLCVIAALVIAVAGVRPLDPAARPGGDPPWIGAAMLVMVAAWMGGMVVTSMLLRRPVRVQVTAHELIVGTLSLPRRAVAIHADGARGGPGVETLTVHTGRERVRFARAATPASRPRPGVDVLLAAVHLDELHQLLTRAGPTPAGTRPVHCLATTRSSRSWPTVVGILLGITAIGMPAVVVGNSMSFGRTAIAMLTAVLGFSAAILVATAGSTPPYTQLRRLIVDADTVWIQDLYTTRTLTSVARDGLTVLRRRWVTPGGRYSPPVHRDGVILADRSGRPILRVGFRTEIAETRDGTDRPPRMRRPRWLIADATADDLHRQLTRR